MASPILIKKFLSNHFEKFDFLEVVKIDEDSQTAENSNYKISPEDAF